MLVSIAAAEPIAGLSDTGVPGEAFFAAALEQARRTSDKVVAAAKYFELRS